MNVISSRRGGKKKKCMKWYCASPIQATLGIIASIQTRKGADPKKAGCVGSFTGQGSDVPKFAD